MSVDLGDWRIDAIDEPLGAGGFGAVYRGRHGRLGVPVAIKALHRPIDGLEDEVRALAVLDHPAIVRLLDVGAVSAAAATDSGGRLVRGAPWMVMELVDGASLGRVPMPWNAFRSVLADLLRGLAHAHAFGIVHGDVTPGNVLVDRGGRGRLTDFGLARVMDGQQRPIRGTMGYMPPEQRAGRDSEIGPWSDLFAVGCIAHAWALGAPPQTVPIGEVRIGDRAPEGLGPWLRRLLEPDPGARPDRAADALNGLFALGELGDGPSARFGDDATITATEAALQASAELSVQISAVTPRTWSSSPPGAFQRAPDFQIRGTAPTGGSERSPAIQLLRTAGGSVPLLSVQPLPFTGRDLERARLWSALERAVAGESVELSITGPPGIGKTRLAEWLAVRAHEEGLADVVWLRTEGGPEGGVAGLLRRARAPALAAGVGPDDELAAVSAVVDRARRPVVAIVDDADRAGALVTALRGARLQIHVGSTPKTDSIALGPIEPSAFRALVRSAVNASPALAERLAAHTGGDPGFLSAVLRDLAARDALIPGPSGVELRDVAIPADPQALWAHRVATVLGSPAQYIAAALAPSELSTFRAACAAAAVDADLDALTRTGLFAIDPTLRVAHPSVAALLAERDPEPVRTHAACASATDPGPLAEAPVAAVERFGRHLAAAGDRDRAFEALRLAGAHRSRRAEYSQAVDLALAAEAALSATPRTDPRWGRIRFNRCDALLLLGRIDEAEALASRIITDAEEHGWPILPWALRTLAQVLQYRGDPGADELYQRALAAFRVAGDDFGAGAVLQTIANEAADRGDLRAAATHFAEAVEHLGRTPRDDMRCAALAGHANAIGLMGRRIEAERALDEARATAVRLSAGTLVAFTTYWRGAVRIARGDLDGGEADCRDALAAFDRIGNPVWIGHVRHALAIVRLRRGDAGGTVAELSEIAMLFDRVGVAERYDARVDLGRALAATGPLDRARATLHEALGAKNRLASLGAAIELLAIATDPTDCEPALQAVERGIFDTGAGDPRHVEVLSSVSEQLAFDRGQRERARASAAEVRARLDSSNDQKHPEGTAPAVR